MSASLPCLSTTLMSTGLVSSCAMKSELGLAWMVRPAPTRSPVGSPLQATMPARVARRNPPHIERFILSTSSVKLLGTQVKNGGFASRGPARETVPRQPPQDHPGHLPTRAHPVLSDRWTKAG